MKLDDHPTVKQYRTAQRSAARVDSKPLDSAWLRALCLELGADDAGFAALDAPALAPSRDRLASMLPRAKSLISLVGRLNPESIRCPSRAASDLDFSTGMHQLDRAARQLVRRLRSVGVRAVNFSTGFPMDMESWPENMWVVSHKLVAEAAGMGRMGRHRLVMHPRFGSFVVLGSVLIDAELSELSKPLDFDPCVDCMLCVAVCPVGALGNDGRFGFTTCLTHNYRDRLGGFADWVENVVTSRSAAEYRGKVSDPETVAMWQALSYGVSNKCSYCMAVCPAGEDNIGDYLDSKKAYNAQVVQPLRARQERVYAVPGSDAVAHVKKRFPHKELKQVSSGLRPRTIRGFFQALPLAFNPGQAEGLDATYHFTFHGKETYEATVDIRQAKLEVQPGHVGQARVSVRADSQTWLRFLAREQHIVSAIIRGKIKVKGPTQLLDRFARCFPL